ncbi:MAG: sugar O-acetyltransferase [Lachnospiraceae bacterium]|nr:sugar O-acetyltransferase [Lachnospiraceae bacterium]
MNIFERLRSGEAIDIRDEQYQREVHGEMDRCRQLCFEINSTPPKDRERIMELENELLHGQMVDGSFFTPPFQVDLANCLHLGKNVFANHGLTVMSVGTITIEDGVMMGPEVGLFTVNHEPENIRVIMTKEIHIKKNAWIGARVNILPGVTIGENAIVGTGSIVTRDVPDNAIVVGNPAKVVKMIEKK